MIYNYELKCQIEVSQQKMVEAIKVERANASPRIECFFLGIKFAEGQKTK